MKIAIVSDDKQTISRHFGRAENYIVVSVEQEKPVEKTILPKLSNCNTDARHHHGHDRKSDPRGSGFGRHSRSKHDQMFKDIQDCDVLVARGMGRGAYQGLEQLGIKPIVTDIVDVDAAVQAILDDTIVNHTEELH
jgi:predicted Fe-Mo cluster-binding NifX family protein